MTVTACPCCRSDVRITDDGGLEIVRMEKPAAGERWLPKASAKGLPLKHHRRRETLRKALAVVIRVAAEYGVTFEELQSPSRERSLVEVRWRAAAAAIEETGAPTTQLGRILNRDHSTVVHGLQQIGVPA